MWVRVGFLPEIDKQVIVSDDKDHFVVLCWDEMKVKEKIAFNKHTCELVDLLTTGKNNNELVKRIPEYDSNSERNCPGEIAFHMLLFMVIVACNFIHPPHTKRVTANQLYPIVLEVVRHVEACNLNDIAFCCDGASPN